VSISFQKFHRPLGQFVQFYCINWVKTIGASRVQAIFNQDYYRVIATMGVCLAGLSEKLNDRTCGGGR
jgi:hypothetical protein